MENFKNLYAINKTLRFELKPYGKTLENFIKKDYLAQDESKAKNRKKMQKMLDENFKLLIEEHLEGIFLNVEDMEIVYFGEQKEREAAMERLKKSITKVFSEKSFKDNYLKTEKHIDRLQKLKPEEEILSEFAGFTTYFTNFFDIRKHVFQGTSKGSISYRLIDENLLTYINNMEKVKKYPPDLLNELIEINEINDLSFYKQFITQKGITKYNEIIGGYSIKEGKKIQGLNEKINLYCQRHKIKLPRLSPLYKMILSDRITNSFIPESIENDQKLIEMLTVLLSDISINNDILIDNIGGVFIKYKNLGKLPGVSYSLVSNLISEEYDAKFPERILKKNYIDDKKKYVESQLYSLGYIVGLLKNTEINLCENIRKKYETLINSYENYKSQFESIEWTDIDNIRQSDNIKFIKDPLDELKEIQRFYDMFEFVNEENNPNPDFYAWLTSNLQELGYEFNDSYNKARNYLTKKQYSTDKFKLNFDNPTLANGWDVNKEIANSAMIFRKYNAQRFDYDYYLGIWEKSVKSRDKNISIDETGNFEKMEYKFYPDPSKMMPKQFFSDKWKANNPWSHEFKEKYDAGLHKKDQLLNVNRYF